MKKRILSLSLALLMLLALLPFGAFAAEENDYTPYVKLLRILQGEARGTIYGGFADFNGDGISELVLTYPKQNQEILDVWTLVPTSDGKTSYDRMMTTVTFEYSGNDHADNWLLITETKDGELGILVHSETVCTSSDPGYEGLVAPTGSDRMIVWKDGGFEWGEKAEFQIWQTQPDKDGNFYYYPDISDIKVNGTPVSLEEYNAWIDRFNDTQEVYGCLSPTQREDGLTSQEIIALIENGFIDVPSGQYYTEPVKWAAANGITKGTSDIAFSPTNSCTRGQVVTFLWRAANSPEPKSTVNPFTDVKESAFYYKAVLWAVEQGITKGMTDTSFAPGADCTRGQVVTFLYRNASSPKVNADNPFSDVKSGAFYYNAVLWAVKGGITKGMTETTFSPDGTCTRGQIVTFLYRDLAK